MANSNSNTNASKSATTRQIPVACHSYETWLLPDATRNLEAQFAAKVLDVANGTRVIASIMCGHVLDLNAIAGGASGSVRTLLSERDTEALARLAVFALDELHTMATDRVEFLNAQAQQGAPA